MLVECTLSALGGQVLCTAWHSVDSHVAYLCLSRVPVVAVTQVVGPATGLHPAHC